MPQHLDVFISSTSIDLPEYRKVVQEAILELGLYPSGMETWPVSGLGSVDLCRQMVERAELFIGVYAYRYGWRPDGDISITEMEYDWAKARPIPRLCFIMSNAHPWPDNRREDDDHAREKLTAFKKRVEGDLTVGYFTTPEDLKARVLAALAPYSQRSEMDVLIPYLRWLHSTSKESGLLRVLDARRNDPTQSGKQISVEQVYTPLNTRRPVMRNKVGKLVSTYPHDRSLPDLEGVGGGNAFLTAMEAANLQDRLVLLGDPGSGKSTFVNFLTLCLTGEQLEPEGGWLAKLAAQGWTQGAYVPMLIVLRDFAQDVPRDLQAGSGGLIWEHIGRDLGKRDCADALPALKRLANQGKLLVLFDGLDEVPPERRVLVRESVTDFMAAAHPANRYLVTCRILSYTQTAWQIPNMTPETIAPFDDEQIATFIAAWYTALIAVGGIDSETAEQRIADLSAGVRHHQLEHIAANPMLLTVMTIVHNHTGALPRESARLYDECVKLLMLRWRPQDARALIEELGVREDDLYNLLWEIAYRAHDEQAEREGAADISEATILGIARGRLNDTVKAVLFVEYIEKRAGLLVGRGQNNDGWRVFSFPHRTFQEYLAGCHVAGDRFSRRAGELAARGAGWREVLLLATGHLVFNDRKRDIPLDAVDRMCPPSMLPHTDSDWQAVVLAAEMLLLTGLNNVESDSVGREVLPRIRERLALLVSEGHLPVLERAAAGRTLALLGDPRRGTGVIASPSPFMGRGSGGGDIPFQG